MNWQHLTYFCTAARTENFRKAADELFVTVSALSKAIASLEEELGVPLFEKRGRNVFLTKYGTAFYEYAHAAMESIEQGKAEMQSMSKNEKGSVKVAGIHTMCSDYLPGMMRKFVDLHPQVSISLGSAICVEVLDRVTEGRADLGFCSDFDPADRRFSDIESILLKKEEFALIVSHDHPFASKQDISIREIDNEKFIMPSNPLSRNRIAFEEICNENDLQPVVDYELQDDSSIMGMVAAGLGVSFMADIPAMHRSNLVIVPIRDLERAQNQYIVWKKSRKLSPAVILFRDFVLKNT